MRSKNEYLGHDFANMCKYLSSFVVVTTAYVASVVNNKYFLLWLPISIFSTLYSYYWDLKFDWGLLDVKFLFREITNI